MSNHDEALIEAMRAAIRPSAERIACQYSADGLRMLIGELVGLCDPLDGVVPGNASASPGLVTAVRAFREGADGHAHDMTTRQLAMFAALDAENDRALVSTAAREAPAIGGPLVDLPGYGVAPVDEIVGRLVRANDDVTLGVLIVALNAHCDLLGDVPLSETSDGPAPDASPAPSGGEVTKPERAFRVGDRVKALTGIMVGAIGEITQVGEGADRYEVKHGDGHYGYYFGSSLRLLPAEDEADEPEPDIWHPREWFAQKIRAGEGWSIANRDEESVLASNLDIGSAREIADELDRMHAEIERLTAKQDDEARALLEDMIAAGQRAANACTGEPSAAGWRDASAEHPPISLWIGEERLPQSVNVAYLHGERYSQPFVAYWAEWPEACGMEPGWRDADGDRVEVRPGDQWTAIDGVNATPPEPSAASVIETMAEHGIAIARSNDGRIAIDVGVHVPVATEVVETPSDAVRWIAGVLSDNAVGDREVEPSAADLLAALRDYRLYGERCSLFLHTAGWALHGQTVAIRSNEVMRESESDAAALMRVLGEVAEGTSA